MWNAKIFYNLVSAILVVIVGEGAAHAQGLVGRVGTTQIQRFKVPPPLSLPLAQKLSKDPEAMRQLLARLPAIPTKQAPSSSGPRTAAPPTGSATTSGSWQVVASAFPPGSGASNPLLLGDGSVIVHDYCTSVWYDLTPDNTGSYVNGTWSQIASMPSNYGPLYFASAVLPDGRVIVEGGEYNFCSAVWTNLGAIYDPVANSWSAVTPPAGWTHIGDAQSVVLDDGTFMLANCCNTDFGGSGFLSAVLNASTRTWTATGSGKADEYDEEGWTKLPDGSVLTVDANTTGTCGTNSERYKPLTGSWSSAGSTIVQLADCSAPNFSYELGPMVFRPSDATGIRGFAGSVIAFGGTTTGSTTIPSHSAILQTASGVWSAGPDIPAVGGVDYTLADAPAALLPTGNVLFAASPNAAPYSTPTHFFEFDGVSFTQVADTSDASGTSSYTWNFLVLPTGQVLATNFSGTISIYTPAGTVHQAWNPIFGPGDYPTSVLPASTYQITGRQLNGRSQGAAYGDDAQAATNYPIVKIVNNATQHVFYARTFGATNTSISPFNYSSANFTVPATIETGASTIYAVANGIASAGQPITVSNPSVSLKPAHNPAMMALSPLSK